MWLAISMKFECLLLVIDLSFNRIDGAWLLSASPRCNHQTKWLPYGGYPLIYCCVRDNGKTVIFNLFSNVFNYHYFFRVFHTSVSL